MKTAFALLLMMTSAQAQPIGPDALDHLPPAQVVVLGEVHDNPVHHANQARALRALHPAAVVWEMLTPEQAAAMPEDRRDPDAVAAALRWQGSGWPDFALYFPLIEAAGSARHFGAGVGRARARRAFTDGAAAVFGAGASRFGLDRALPTAQETAREDEQFAAHCEAMPRAMMGGMVEAQRLRDASLAAVALQALHETGGPVAVITGSGHARTDWGMPALLRTAAPDISVLSVGQVESDPGPHAPPDLWPWDLWIVTAAQERPDPCAAFQ